jgi:hypothetical protein
MRTRWRWLYVVPAIWAALLAYWLFVLVRPWRCPPNAFTCLPPILWALVMLVTLIAALIPFEVVSIIVRRVSSNRDTTET